MKILKKYSCLIIMLWVSVLSVKAADIKIFDVGQGSCVALKHKGKVLVVDAGSSERAFLAAYQHRSQRGKLYKINAVETMEVAYSVDPERGEGGAAAAAILASPSPSSEESVSPSEVGKAASETLTLTLKNSIREFMEGDDVKEIVVVATHADKDHVGWLPTLLDSTFKQRDRLKAVVLSGFSRDYASTLEEWLSELGKERIIYTGTYGGNAGYPKNFYSSWSLEEEWTPHTEEEPVVSAAKRGCEKEEEILFARFYHSGIEKKTTCEKRIERCLDFGPSLRVEILSMNSGMAMDRVKIHEPLGETIEKWHLSRANMDPNANSLVLRIASKEMNGKSILIPGDADETTWGRITAQGPVEPVTYMLLSHHGSQEHGGTSQAVLDAFKPRAFFISAGQHKGYHHPAVSVVNLCREYLQRHFPPYHCVESHAITYFQPKKGDRGKVSYVYRRRVTAKPIFSTITQGTMGINLEEEGENDIKIETSRDKSRIFSHSEGGNSILFLSSSFQVYENEQEVLDALIKSSAGKIFVFKEKKTDPGETEDKTSVKLLTEKQEIQGTREISEQEDATIEKTERTYVLREREGKFIVYTVLPYEEVLEDF